MWTNVSCMHESCETPIFKQNFTNWKDKEASATPIFEKEYEGVYVCVCMCVCVCVCKHLITNVCY